MYTRPTKRYLCTSGIFFLAEKEKKRKKAEPPIHFPAALPRFRDRFQKKSHIARGSEASSTLPSVLVRGG